MSYFNWAAHSPPQVLVEGKEPVDWTELVAVAKGYIGELLGHNPRDVSLHHNTTAAFQRIVIRLRLYFEGLSPVLLITDQEYPGLVALLDEQWPGPIVMVSISDCIWNGDVDKARERLNLASRRYKPQVVLISHVSRSSGLFFRDEWLSEMKECAPDALFILDGAQAVGNVELSGEVISRSDFYVFSGHKWLRGLPTLGIVVADQQKWSVDDPAQGYSVQVGSRGTGSERVLSSLIEGLQRLLGGDGRHCSAAAAMALKLAQKLVSAGLVPFGVSAADSWTWNGIVSVPIDVRGGIRTAAANLNYAYIEGETFRSAEFGSAAAGPRFVLQFRQHVTSTEVRWKPTLVRVPSYCDVPVPLPARGLARFCVSWDHTEDELQELVARLAEEA